MVIFSVGASLDSDSDSMAESVSPSPDSDSDSDSGVLTTRDSCSVAGDSDLDSDSCPVWTLRFSGVTLLGSGWANPRAHGLEGHPGEDKDFFLFFLNFILHVLC